MISVIIPAYNRAGTIERSIRSVLNQTCSEQLECIVVDDCSTDNTRQVVESIQDSRVRYDCLEKNQGACVARNRGIELAQGEYIAFQDSDDEWLPDKLGKQLSALLKTHADVCFCKLEKHYVNDEKPPFMFPKMSGSHLCTQEELFLSSKASTQAIFAKKYVCDEIRFDPNLKKSQDHDWIIRVSEKYQVYYLDMPLAVQYIQADSISLGGSQKYVEVKQYFLDKYQYKFQEHPEFKVALLKHLAIHKVMLGQNAVQEYQQIYQLEHNPKNLTKYVLARAGLIRPVLKLLGHRETKI